MCLTETQPIPEDLGTSGRGWKCFWPWRNAYSDPAGRPGDLLSACGFGKDLAYQPDHWYTATKTQLWSVLDQPYLSGFHVFLSEQDAEDARCLHSLMVVREVEWHDPVAYGLQAVGALGSPGVPCVVVSEMRIVPLPNDPHV